MASNAALAVIASSGGPRGATGATGATGPQTTFYGTSTTNSNTYTSTIVGATPLASGYMLGILFSHAPTGACTLNVNTTSNVAIVDSLGNPIAASKWADNQFVLMMYDGTKLRLPPGL